MKEILETYTCDTCNKEIEGVGFSFKGGLYIVTKHKWHGGLLGGAKDDVLFHYCSKCLIKALAEIENDANFDYKYEARETP